MILEVSAAYKATVRRKRARDFIEAWFHVRARVEVAEVSADDLDLVASLDLPLDNHSRHRVPPTYPSELRWFGDGLIQPLVQVGEERVIRESFDADWLTGVVRPPAEGGASGWPNPFAAFAIPHRGVMDPADVAVFGESTETQVVAALHARARETAIVDGRVWTRVAEPRLVVGNIYDRQTNDVIFYGHVVAGETFSGKHGHPPGVTYRLDQSDLIERQYAKAVEENDISLEMPRIAVFRPDLLTYRADQVNLLDAARADVATLAKHLGAESIETMVAYAHLRDAIPDYAKALEAGAATDDEGFAARLRAVSEAGGSDWAPKGRPALHRYEMSHEDLSHLATMML